MRVVLLATVLVVANLLCAQTVRIAKYKDDKPCAISYTFDDGLKEHYRLVAPILEKHGFRGTFWINGVRLTTIDSARLTKAEVKQMSDRGHEISNHGWSHKSLPRSTEQEAIVEIERNDSMLLAVTGIKPKTFCYPGNGKNEQSIRLASKGRVGTRTRQFSMGSKSTHENLEKRVDEIIATNDWGVAMIHGINYGYDAFKNSNILWAHLEKVKKLEDKIWVGTFEQVAAYTKEADNISLEIKKLNKSTTITPILELDKELFTMPLTMIIDNPTPKTKVYQGKKRLKVKQEPAKIIFDFDPFGGDLTIKK